MTSSPFPFSASTSSRFLSRLGFTLVELLVVIAILGVLAAIALPAYNNYALKSRFSEVILATAPTKTAIGACATGGDCVNNGAIFLGSSPSSTSLPIASGVNAVNTSYAAVYAVVVADLVDSGASMSNAVATANAYVSAQQKNNPSYVAATSADGTKACLIDLPDYNAGVQCGQGSTTLASVNQYMTAANNPYYSSAVYNGGGAATLLLPCVGASGSGCSPSTKYASTVVYSSNGLITATATSAFGLKQETFTLSPVLSSGRVDWMVSGSCKTRSSGALC